MTDTNPVAENWLRGVIFDVARQAKQPMAAKLKAYALDQANNPTGRGVAMELLLKESPQTANELITGCLNDPSLALQEMAVEQAIERTQQLAKDQPDLAIADYQKSLASYRHPRQLARIIEALGKLGKDISTADAFVLVTDWQSVAPFDNVNGVGDNLIPRAGFLGCKNDRFKNQTHGQERQYQLADDHRIARPW